MTGIAIFGAGRIGRIHAANLHQHPAAQINYVVDVVSDFLSKEAVWLDGYRDELLAHSPYRQIDS